MFSRIVVPLDGSAFAEAALGTARGLARTYHGQILVVRVEPWIGAETGADHVPTAAQADTSARTTVERLDEADAYLHRIVSQLHAEGFDADFTLFVSAPGSGIARAAELDQADVIVMAAHLRGMLPEHAAPSTTLSVLARAQVPIFVCRDCSAAVTELASAETPIIVPLDGSRLAETALPYASALARDFGASLVLVRVLEAHAPQSADTDARAYLQSVREEIAQSGGHALTEVRYGAPTGGIEAVWHQYNGGLIVLACHGGGDRSRAILGRVAANLIEQIEAPLLVVQTRGAIPVGQAVRSADGVI